MGTAETQKKTVEKKTAKKKASDDLIINVAHEVENMNKEAAFKAADGLDENIEFSYFKLGGILSRIHIEQWYIEEGFEKFPDFVEARFGVRRSKAFHLIGIYNGLIESGVAWNKVSSIGWTKLKELVNVVTPENVDEWVTRANDMTIDQLRDYIKKHLQGDTNTEDGVAGAEDDSKKISTLAFKVHKDQRDLIEQALDKGKSESGTDFPAVALEAICMSFLSGPSKNPEKANGKLTEADLKEAMENFTWQDVLGVFEKIWPDVDVTVETE